MVEPLFEGRVVIVTGAASGIGRATAKLFARHGAQVLCSDVAADPLTDTVDAIRAEGGEARALTADVTAPETPARLVSESLDAFGRLDHAFNNAGVVGTHTDALNEEKMRRVLAINLEAVMMAMKYQIEYMVEHGGGTIVNTASVAGLSGSAGSMDYAAAKHGVVGFSKTAALKYGRQGIRINVVCPGIIQTAMTGVLNNISDVQQAQIERLSPITGAPGDAMDIAEAVIWLSSAKSRFVHGVALPVDGGFMI